MLFRSEINGGLAAHLHLERAVVAEGAHPRADRGLLEVGGGRALHDEAPDVVADEEELVEFLAELDDRFGTPPPEVDQLAELAKLRIWAHRRGLASVHLEDRYAVFSAPKAVAIHNLREHSRGRVRVADPQSGYLPLPNLVHDGKALDAAAVLAAIKSLLQPNRAGS